MNRNAYLAIVCVLTAFVSLNLQAQSIVISDGPAPSQIAGNAVRKIVETDGPAEWTAAQKQGHRLIGSWIIQTDGPGTGRLVGPEQGKELASVPPSASSPENSELPNPETSTLAPVASVTQSAKTIPEPPAEKHIELSQWSSVHADDFFYVYSDHQKLGNHFAPSGWMGDVSDIHFDDSSRENPRSGATCIRITYTGRSSQGSGWAGLYWQNPANNWGENEGGYDLSGKRRLTFWARGAKGGEVISEFKMGGLSGTKGDSDSASITSIVLSKDWQPYTIELSGKDLRHIIGGFCWVVNRDSNPSGMTFFLDDIRYE